MCSPVHYLRSDWQEFPRAEEPRWPGSTAPAPGPIRLALGVQRSPTCLQGSSTLLRPTLPCPPTPAPTPPRTPVLQNPNILQNSELLLGQQNQSSISQSYFGETFPNLLYIPSRIWTWTQRWRWILVQETIAKQVSFVMDLSYIFNT
jgi:hypothetical protein